MRGIYVFGGVVAAAFLLGAAAWGRLDPYRVTLPEAQVPRKRVTIPQNWTEAQREQFHFEAQGTRLLPIRWFLALEQPCFSPFGCGLLSDSNYLRRFGFIDSPKSERNPHGLPIGFAVDREFVDPRNGRAMPVVGLTCAACHTGEIMLGDTAFQIEGAPAMVDLAAFQKAVGLALGFTVQFPGFLGRWGRFEQRVLGDQATESAKRELREQVNAAFAAGKHEKEVTTRGHIYDISAGFMRTDALTRIGNQVFADDMGIDGNYAPAHSPVRFPQIWDASWFTWVQYNSSIADPLVRNIGQALGLRAVANLRGDKAKEFESSVNIPGLWRIEELLSGPAPFAGLASPKWPAEFPALDTAKAEAGKDLYRKHCQGCHLPPRDELLADLKPTETDKKHKPKYWRESRAGSRWFLEVTDIPLDRIGTDRHQAADFFNRKADSGGLGKGVISAKDGLDVVTLGIADRFFRMKNFTPEQRIAWSGGRDPSLPRVRAGLYYKARPLNGIWAAAPYLHNGSVPTLDALLSPDENARPKRFWMASKQFDPVKVGYSGAKIDGATEFDVNQPGNSNAGHWFKDGPRGNGVIGPALSETERAQIIEFLKSL